MILFSSDKEIIFKITNAVLLIWLVGAIAIAVSSTIQLLVPDPAANYSYAEYKDAYCVAFDEKTTDALTDAEKEKQCESDYNNYKLNNDSSDRWDLISLYTSIANVVIVGGVLYFLNRKKGPIKK